MNSRRSERVLFHFFHSIAVILLASSLLIGATQTINTLPVSNSSFLSTLQAFLRSENANRFAKQFAGYVFSGGLGTTSASLAHTVPATVGLPYGYYVSQIATAHTYTATTRTYVYLDYDDARTVTIAGATVTRATNLLFAEMAAGSDEPATPSGTVALMRVDTNGTAITAVADLRPGTEIPIECYSTFANAVATAPTNMTLLLNTRVFPAADATVSQGFRVLAGGWIQPASGKTVTLSRFVGAPLIQWISTASGGAVAFGTSLASPLYPEYWGAVADGDATTDDSTAFAACLSAAPNGAVIKLSSQAGYYLASGITLGATNFFVLEGPATIYYGGTAACITISGNSTATVLQHNLKNLKLIASSGNERNGAGQIGVTINGSSGHLFEHVIVLNFTNGFRLYNNADFWTENNTFIHCRTRDCDKGWYITKDVAATKDSFATNKWYGCSVAMANSTAGSYGIYVDTNCSIYRCSFDLTIFPNCVNCVGFYHDGKGKGVHGYIDFEGQSAAGNVAMQFGSSSKLVTWNLTVRPDGVSDNFLVDAAGSDLIGIYNLGDGGYGRVLKNADAVYTSQEVDEDGTTFYTRDHVSAAGIPTRYVNTEWDIRDMATPAQFANVFANCVGDLVVNTSNSTSISVAGVRILFIDYSAATSLANFTDGVDGQELLVHHADTLCTIVETGNIVLKGTASSVKAKTNESQSFVYRSAVSKWYEIFRSW